MDITDEMVEAGVQAYRVCEPGLELRAEIASILRAAAPLIAAQALRQAAEFVRDDETGAFAHGDLCSYGPPGMCDCERGITFRWLWSRALGRCGKDNPHKAGYACSLDAGHVPVDDHRFGPVVVEPRQPEEPKRTCPRCGSPEWVAVSLDQGYTRRAQCVPCGHYHPGILGPGWRSS